MSQPETTEETAEVACREFLVKKTFQVERQIIVVGEIITDREFLMGQLKGPLSRGWIVDLALVDLGDNSEEQQTTAEAIDLPIDAIGLTQAILGKVQAAGIQTRSQLLDYLEGGNLDSLKLAPNQVESMYKRLEETKAEDEQEQEESN